MLVSKIGGPLCNPGTVVVNVEACKKVGAPNVLVTSAVGMCVVKPGSKIATLVGARVLICTCGPGGVCAGTVMGVEIPVCGAVVEIMSTCV